MRYDVRCTMYVVRCTIHDDDDDDDDGDDDDDDDDATRADMNHSPGRSTSCPIGRIGRV